MITTMITIRSTPIGMEIPRIKPKPTEVGPVEDVEIFGLALDVINLYFPNVLFLRADSTLFATFLEAA
jgi:hypothetical protein